MPTDIGYLSLIEPMLPAEGTRVLEDLATDLIAKSHSLQAVVNPALSESLAELVRSMNCYYSNLIEGHHTHPRDIDRALADDFATEPKQRALQLEAKAHIEVQRLIDSQSSPVNVVSADYLCWIHREFCQRLPAEFLVLENPQTGRQIQLQPGEFRTGGVKIGAHIPISAPAIPRFLQRFEQAYNPRQFSKVRQVIAVAASHHRLLWIHPFYDGNGRVARLFSQSFLKEIGLGNGLWSVSRGLARSLKDYRRFLREADRERWNDWDGRGNLSAIEEQVRLKQLPKRSFPLLREAVLVGEYERGKASQITGYQERQARTVLNQLVKAGLLVSDTPRGAVRLGFPSQVVERYFPNLYPSLS